MRLILLVVSLLFFSTSPSLAQRIYCPLPEDGAWVNPDAAPKEISRIEVESRCENEQVEVRVRAFTACVPRDCKWGWTKGRLRSDGVIQVRLSGFFSSKLITLKAFGDLLDTQVINIPKTETGEQTTKVYNLERD